MILLRVCAVVWLALLASVALAQGVTLPPVERVVLENGVIIVLHEKHDVPLVGIEATIRGGAITDPDGLGGSASLLANAIEKGAGARDAAAFAEAIDAVGGALAASAELEAITVSGEFMARDADLMVRLLTDMLRAPTLDRAEIEKLRDRTIDQIGAAKDSDLRSLTPVYGSRFLFPDHPYGNSLLGDEESLARITPADLRAYYKDWFGGDRLVVAVAGDFDAPSMLAKLRAAFGDWPAAARALPPVVAPAPVVGRRVLLIDKPGAAQSYFWIGNVGVGLHAEGRAELDIANTLFGGRFTSLLMEELRTKAGLTYDARSTLRRESAGGSLAMLSSTKTETTLEAIDLALSLLAKLRDEGVADDMIASGKNYILGQFAPRLETAEQLAAQFAALETYGLDEAYVNAYGSAIAAADGEAIRSVIREIYPDPDNLVFAIIGDGALIREQIAKYGPVTEMSIAAPRFRP